MSNSIRTRGLSEAQAAQYLGVARSTLRQARTTGNVQGRCSRNLCTFQLMFLS